MQAKVILQYLIFFGLAIGLLWWSVKDIDTASLLATIKKANYSPLFVITIAGFLSHFFRALRWKILIEPLGVKVRILNSWFAIMIAYIVNLATPRMGEVARCAILAKYEKVSADKLAGTMITERVFDLLCLIILALLTYFIEKDALQLVINPINEIVSFKKILLVFIIMVAAVVGVFLFLILNKKNADSKLVKIVANLWNGISSVQHLQNKLQFFIYTFAIWFCYWFMTYWGFKSMQELQGLDVGAGLSVLIVGSIAMIVTPGGTGSFQKLVGNILLPLAYGIELEKATAFSFLSWGVQTLILIIGGFVSIILLPIYNTHLQKQNVGKV